jgi:uncharacterized protein (DUF952 family)
MGEGLVKRLGGLSRGDRDGTVRAAIRRREGGPLSRIYKVATRTVIEASRAAGRFAGMPVDRADGYVHFSTAEQLGETLRRHFAGQSGLILFAVEAEALGASLRWEPSRGGALFPHLYGELAMEAIEDEATIAVGADGAVALPEWVR